MRQLGLVMGSEAQELISDAVVAIPGEAFGAPILEPARRVSGRDEELHLHLLELAGAKNEVAGGDLVAKAATDLGNAERWLQAHRGHDVRKVHEHSLGSLRAQVGDSCF